MVVLYISWAFFHGSFGLAIYSPMGQKLFKHGHTNIFKLNFIWGAHYIRTLLRNFDKHFAVPRTLHLTNKQYSSIPLSSARAQSPRSFTCDVGRVSVPIY